MTNITKEVSAKDAKNRFGELLDAAQRAPVRITKNGRNVAVMLSQEEYARFEDMEDALWAAEVTEVTKNPEFIGEDASEAFLKKFRGPDA